MSYVMWRCIRGVSLICSAVFASISGFLLFFLRVFVSFFPPNILCTFLCGKNTLGKLKLGTSTITILCFSCFCRSIEIITCQSSARESKACPEHSRHSGMEIFHSLLQKQATDLNSNYNNNNNNNNNHNNHIQRRYSRFSTISSQHRELSPTRMLKWPGRNCVQITCNTSSAYHVQVSCYMPLGTKGQLSC